jgi:DNA polymerase-3 subunit beta
MKCTLTGEQFKRLIIKSGKTGNSLFFRTDKNNHALLLHTSNLESWIEAKAPASVDQEGSITLPLKPLVALAAHIANHDSLLLEQKDRVLKITTKQGKTALHGFEDARDMDMPTHEGDGLFRVATRVFFPACRRALVSVARSTLKPELSSVLLRFTDDSLVLASTDGFRLTEENITKTSFSQYPVKKVNDILVPYRAMEEMIRVFEDDEEEISGSASNGLVSISSPSARLCARTTEGLFPHYEQIIPSQFTVSIAVSRPQLHDMLRQASVFSGKLYNISLSFSSQNNELLLHTFNQDVGEFSSVLPASGEGESREIVCNWRYFLDGIQGFSGDQIGLSFTNESTPLVMRDPHRPYGLYLLMPMRGM